MTPSHDGSRTPLHGGAWDPSSANTPARSEAEFDYTLDAPTPSPVSKYVFHFSLPYQLPSLSVFLSSPLSFQFLPLSFTFLFYLLFFPIPSFPSLSFHSFSFPSNVFPSFPFSPLHHVSLDSFFHCFRRDTGRRTQPLQEHLVHLTPQGHLAVFMDQSPTTHLMLIHLLLPGTETL